MIPKDNAWNEARLQSYIDNKIEESLTLDYKAAGTLHPNNQKRADDVAKDVSAFANSAGGTIIYGLREYGAHEKRHLAEKIDPMKRGQISREQLEHFISNIQRRPEVIITPVPIATAPDDVCYVVEIPQAKTAHMATDNKYYKRHNFESVAMEDHEVRDVMRRTTHPVVSTEVRINLGRAGIKNELWWKVKNDSDVIARHVCTVVEIPIHLKGRHMTCDDYPTRRDIDGYMWRRIQFGTGRYPLFPRSENTDSVEFSLEAPLQVIAGEPLLLADFVRVTTYADEMPFTRQNLPLDQVISISKFRN